MKIKNIHHIELTVGDLGISKDFYSKLPDFKIVAKYPNFIMFFNGYFYLGITDHHGKTEGKKFSELNLGLDHVSFEVETKIDLTKAIKFFDKEGINHAEIKKLSNNLYVLAFRDPDNIQLELCWKEKVK